MIYLDLDYIKRNVIPTIEKHYSNPGNPTADYLSEHEAMENLIGCLERVRLPYVQGVIPKAAQLFLLIDLGHYFSNGNKRMALTVLLSFILENGCAIYSELPGTREETKEEYKDFLTSIFPEFNAYEDELDFYAAEFGFYNLTLAVLELSKQGISFDGLKERVEKFLRITTIPPEEMEDRGEEYMTTEE